MSDTCKPFTCACKTASLPVNQEVSRQMLRRQQCVQAALLTISKLGMQVTQGGVGLHCKAPVRGVFW